jgi:hypothetical protein
MNGVGAAADHRRTVEKKAQQKWRCRRLQYRILGFSVGTVVPVGLASMLWAAKAVKEERDAGVLQPGDIIFEENGEGSRSELVDDLVGSRISLGKAIDLCLENPVMTAASMALFAIMFGIFGIGASFEVGLVKRLLECNCCCGDDSRTRSSTIQSERASKSIACSAVIAVAWGALVGFVVVVLILYSTHVYAAVALGCLIGAGIAAPLACNLGGAVEVVASHKQARDRSGCCIKGLSSCALGIARIPCFCGAFTVYANDDASAQPQRTPSPRILIAWLFTIISASTFGCLTAVFSIAASDTQADMLSQYFLSENSTNSSKVYRAMLHVDEMFSMQFNKLRRERESAFDLEVTQIIILAFCSLFWDIFVIYYHMANPPHPKFRLRPSRRLSIYVHVFAGLAEIVASVVSFAIYSGDVTKGTSNNRTLVVYIHVFCSLTHAITAAYQTPQVFGMKVIMVPAYSIVVFWKAVCAVRMGMDPNSLWILMQLFFTHHIYVWTRAFHVIFEEMDVFQEHTYSISILFAGMVLGPVALGPAANVAVISVISLFGLLRLPYWTIEKQEEWKLEHRSNMLLNSAFRREMRQLAYSDNLYTLMKEEMRSFDKSESAVDSRSYAPPHSGLRVKEVKIVVGDCVKAGMEIAVFEDAQSNANAEWSEIPQLVCDSFV